MENIFKKININKETVIKAAKTAGKVVLGAAAVGVAYVVGRGDAMKAGKQNETAEQTNLLEEPETIEVTEFEEVKEESEDEGEESA